MAEKEDKEDLDLDAQPAAKSNKKMIIIMALVGLLLMGGTAGVMFFLLGGGDKGGEGGGAAEEVVVPETHYMPLEKMVVNFAQKGPAKFLQVEMQLMAHDPAVLSVIEEHMPVIRNDILVMLGSQTYEGLSSREGKDKLSAEILNTVQSIVKEQAELEGPQAVYFTNFVMQ